MAIIPWLYISLSKSILVEVILRDRKIFFDQGTFIFEICYHFKFHISFFFLYKITETDIVILKESSKFDESLAEWVHLLSPLFSRVKFIAWSYERTNLRITLYMHTHNESFPRHRHKLCSNIVLPRRIRGPRRGSRIYPSGSRDSQARSRASINARENPSLKGRWDRGALGSFRFPSWNYKLCDDSQGTVAWFFFSRGVDFGNIGFYL